MEKLKILHIFSIHNFFYCFNGMEINNFLHLRCIDIWNIFRSLLPEKWCVDQQQSTEPESAFFLKKISPELTSAANPPLFAEGDWPWADIRAHLPLLYLWNAYHSMACQAVPCPHPGSEPRTPGSWRGMCELNCCATGQAPRICILIRSPGEYAP